MNKTTLITGGAGFIGSHLAEYLVLQPDNKVIVVDDLSGGKRDNIPMGVKFELCDVTDKHKVDTLFDQYSFDYVFHLAAYAAEGMSPFIRKFNYTNNLIGSINLINASIRHKVKHFVFFSSIAAYGDSPLDDTQLNLHPIDPYGISKYAVELDLQAAHEQFGLRYTVFRPHNVYGERQNINDRFRNVMGIFMKQKLKNEPVTIFGDGNQTRAFTYVADIIPAVASAISNELLHNDAFNLGTDTFLTVNQLADLLSIPDTSRTYLPERHEVKHAEPKHDKIQSIIGSLPSTPLEVGINKMWGWAQQEALTDTKLPFELEITENCPWKI